MTAAQQVQWTPGPWQVNSTDHFQVCDADGEVRGCAPIARCDVGTFAERRANARLIAASPAILDALMALTDAVETRCPEHEGYLVHCAQEARAAITKALAA